MAGTVAGSNGVAFLVSAGIVYEIIAAACSSPQTTEINAGARADTLMKWVYIGEGQAALFVAIAAMIEPDKAKAIIGGGVLAGVLMHTSYYHAKASGLQNGGPTTETYEGATS